MLHVAFCVPLNEGTSSPVPHWVICIFFSFSFFLLLFVGVFFSVSPPFMTKNNKVPSYLREPGYKNTTSEIFFIKKRDSFCTFKSKWKPALGGSVSVSKLLKRINQDIYTNLGTCSDIKSFSAHYMIPFIPGTCPTEGENNLITKISQSSPFSQQTNKKHTGRGINVYLIRVP